MPTYQDLIWSSPDGLSLHARDYPGPGGIAPLLCLPGPTRNARDFGGLADRVAGRRRLIAIDYRGRGESAPARDAATYNAAAYVADCQALMAEQALDRVALVGSSFGGALAMLIAQAEPLRVVGALLNDIGPESEAVGLGRIRGTVGRTSSYPTWMHAARAAQESYGEIYPDWRIDDWLDMAKRLYRLTSAGRIVLDYDQRIAESVRIPTADPASLWAALATLDTKPVLLVRAGRSDILSATVAERMMSELGLAEMVEAENVGHAPTLKEPAIAPALNRWLDRLP